MEYRKIGGTYYHLDATFDNTLKMKLYVNTVNSKSKGKKFCSNCGAKLMKECPKCGHDVEDGVKFCPDCGALD